jgi:two-component system OmpR family sensor kinase
MRARRDIAAATALRTAAPLLALLPLLAIVVWVAVSKGLAPLRRITRELQARDADALSPLGEADLPEETRPLVGATNALLQRLRRAIEAQRSFIADAAHELRTPLTALRLQAQIAARAQTDGERQSAFADLQRGLDRSTRLVEQLLTLARQEPGAREAPQERFDLAALARSVVSDLAVLAAARGIDLGITRSEPAFISGSPDAVRILLSNLVDNALRYAHAGGRVDLAAEALDGQASVIIEDTGPGVPAENLGNLFERFFRVPGQSMPGSGLGLAIVKKIADAHHAEVGLENTGTGLRVTVRFPAAPMPAKALLS